MSIENNVYIDILDEFLAKGRGNFGI